jgi:hypothetical protein
MRHADAGSNVSLKLLGKGLPVSLAALLALALAACGGSTKTVTIPTPAGQGGSTDTGQSRGTTGSQTTSTGTQGTTSTGVQPPTTPSEPPTKIVHLESFVSPTRNIGCMIIGGLARCDIEKRSWSPPARPSSCPNIVDFGQGMEVGHSGAGRLVCAGDTARDITSPKLAYGSGSDVAGFMCVSRPSGMTCTSTSSGHGFFINAQGYKLF